MKLFQIEEPDGSPADPEAPGAAIGIDCSGAFAEVAVAIGGNAVILADREGFERELPVPTAADGDWATLFEGARLRAERALARPVTHAVVAVRAGSVSGTAEPERLVDAAAVAGMVLLHVADVATLPKGEPPANGAAVLAEDLAPRGEGA